MEVDLVVVFTYPLIDGVVENLYLWDVVSLGKCVEPNIQEGRFSAGWFKFPVHPHLLDAEATVSVVRLDLFGRFNHSIDSLVLGH